MTLNDQQYNFDEQKYLRRKRHDRICVLILFLLAFLSLMICYDVLAYNNGTGVLTYYTETPTGDPLSLYVHRGDTIYMNRNYDLSGVVDYNKQFAYWKNYADADNTCTPDIIVNVSYIETNGKVKTGNVAINPVNGWVVGDWWVWDGCKEHRKQVKDQYGNLQTIVTYEQDPNDNRFAFHIVPMPGETQGPPPDPCWDTNTCGTTKIVTFGTAVPIATETPFQPNPPKPIPIWIEVGAGIGVVIGGILTWKYAW